MVRQISLDAWHVRHLADLLARAGGIVERTGRPIVLYRQTVEESEGSYEEIVCTLAGGHVIEQTVTSGGVIPPSFSHQAVFAAHDYPGALLAKSKDRFLELTEFLEGQLGHAS